VIDGKLEMAGRLGARYASNGTAEDPAETIQALGGADAAIVLAAVPSAFEQALPSLRPNGTLVMVGLLADNIMRVPLFETVLKGITVVGSLVGTRIDLAETFELHADGRTKIVSETRSVDRVNDAMAEVEQGRVDARLVFDLRA
jgi:propanol-preferring alcohol dehydrogenase